MPQIVLIYHGVLNDEHGIFYRPEWLQLLELIGADLYAPKMTGSLYSVSSIHASAMLTALPV